MGLLSFGLKEPQKESPKIAEPVPLPTLAKVQKILDRFSTLGRQLSLSDFEAVRPNNEDSVWYFTLTKVERAERHGNDSYNTYAPLLFPMKYQCTFNETTGGHTFTLTTQNRQPGPNNDILAVTFSSTCPRSGEPQVETTILHVRDKDGKDHTVTLTNDQDANNKVVTTQDKTNSTISSPDSTTLFTNDIYRTTCVEAAALSVDNLTQAPIAWATRLLTQVAGYDASPDRDPALEILRHAHEEAQAKATDHFRKTLIDHWLALNPNPIVYGREGRHLDIPRTATLAHHILFELNLSTTLFIDPPLTPINHEDVMYLPPNHKANTSVRDNNRQRLLNLYYSERQPRPDRWRRRLLTTPRTPLDVTSNYITPTQRDYGLNAPPQPIPQNNDVHHPVYGYSRTVTLENGAKICINLSSLYTQQGSSIDQTSVTCTPNPESRKDIAALTLKIKKTMDSTIINLSLIPPGSTEQYELIAQIPADQVTPPTTIHGISPVSLVDQRDLPQELIQEIERLREAPVVVLSPHEKAEIRMMVMATYYNHGLLDVELEEKVRDAELEVIRDKQLETRLSAGQNPSRKKVEAFARLFHDTPPVDLEEKVLSLIQTLIR